MKIILAREKGRRIIAGTFAAAGSVASQEKGPRHRCLGPNPPMEEVEETTGSGMARRSDSSFPMKFSLSAFLLRCNIGRGGVIRRDAVASSRQNRSTTSPEESPAAMRKGTAVDCTVDWLPGSGMAFAAETGSGHLIVMDGAPDGGGRNLAPRPMETVLAGTGGCTAYDVVLILRRGRHEVTGCRVQLTSERAADDPKVFTKIHLHFVVSGPALTDAVVERAVRLSHEKYCSATIMLGKTAAITTSFEVRRS